MAGANRTESAIDAGDPDGHPVANGEVALSGGGPLGAKERPEAGADGFAPTLLSPRAGIPSERFEDDAELRLLLGAPERYPVGWADTVLGQRVGRYLVERCIGHGGMSVVFVARDTIIGRQVALKFLAGVHATPADLRAWFEREAQAAGRIDHKRVARLYDVGEFEGRLFLAMEHVLGETLRAVMRREHIETERALRIVCDLCDATRAIHEAGFVHRDLKPENVMLDEQDRLKVLDLGLAKWCAPPFETSAPPSSAKVTGALGTPGYMAPEQIRGETVDARADVFSLGVILYELLFDRQPYPGESPTEVLERTLEGRVEIPSLDTRLDALSLRLLLVQALASEREERLPTVERMRSELERILVARTSDAPTSVPNAGETMPVPRESSALPSKAGANGAGARRSIALVVCAVALLGGVALTISARMAGVRPPDGMALIPGARIPLGIVREAEECAAMAVPCPPILRRELGQGSASVASFFLDAHEVTVEDFVQYLRTVQNQLHFVSDADVLGRYFASFPGGRTLIEVLPGGSLRYSPDDNKVHIVDGRGRLPMTAVTWYGAAIYCLAQSKRLPTEAEWELAAGGAGHQRYPWGNDAPVCGRLSLPPRGTLRMRGECTDVDGGLWSVGTSSFDTTPEGLHDLAGNATEWTASAPSAPTQGAPSSVDELLAAVGPTSLRSVRGGSYAESFFARSTGRGQFAAGSPSPSIGFRCAQSIP